MAIAHRIQTLPAHARERIEHALNRNSDRLAAARYRAATGYDLPLAERADWLHHAALGAPVIKHKVSRFLP